MSGILQTLIYGVSVVKDAYFNLVTLLLNTTTTNGAQNNTFLDSSSNNFSITRNGNTTQGTFTPFSQTGWSDYFSSSYLQTSSAVIASTTSTFTIEAWVYMTQLPTTGGSPNVPCLIGDFAGTSSTNYWGFGPMSTGLLQFFWYDGASKSATGNTTMAANTWNHIAISVNANAISMYVNGVQQTITGTSTLTNRSSSLSYTTIGQYNTSTGVYYGYVSNMSVLSGTAKYSGSTITVPTAPLSASTTNQTLLTCASNSFADINTATTAKTLTIGGTPSVQSFSPFAPTAAYSTTTVGGSGYFDGTGDYLVFGSGQANANLNGNCSIELWFYPTGAAAAGLLTAKYGGTTNQFYLNSQSNNLIYCEFLGSTFYAKTSSGSFTRNAWNHLLITKSSTTAKMWLNGVYEGAWTVSTTNSSTDAIGVGATQGGATTFNGYISGIRYSNTATETGTSNITLPTAPLTSNGNTAALLSFTNAGIFDSTAKNVLETVGGAQVVSPTPAKFGSSSMYFDGTGDYLVGPNSPWMNLGTSDFTMECFVYFNSVSSTQMFVSTNYNAGTGAGGWSFLYRADNTTLQFSCNANVAYGKTWSPSTGQWYHVAVSRSGSNLRLFVNGTQLGTTSTSTDNITGATTLCVGSTNVGGTPLALNGYLDELRVTYGNARYTANFTAPISAFPVQ